MNYSFGSCMGCAMGQIDEEGFDWSTGEYADAGSNGGGLSDQGAAVLTSAIDGIADIGRSIISAVGGGTTSTPATVTTPRPGAGTINHNRDGDQPTTAGMDPVMLAAIGIPAALIAVALMRGKT